MNRLDERLDETDRKLVAILQAHGRKPTASIARDLNLSRTAVQARIARLERDGIILGYSANLAFHTGGNVAALVMLRLSVRPIEVKANGPNLSRLQRALGSDLPAGVSRRAGYRTVKV